MTYATLRTATFFGAALFAASSASAETVLFEDFEDAAVTYTANVADDLTRLGDRDFYGRVADADLPNGANYSGVRGNSFYALEDTNGAQNSANPIILSWSAIDISSFTNLNLSFFFAEDDAGSSQDWDANTSVRIAIQLDGGGFSDAFAIEAEEPGNDQFDNIARVDTDLDGIGDGAEITDTFSQFNFDIADGGLLDIQITFENLTAGDEDIAFDDLRLTGTNLVPVPLPAGIWLLGLGLAGLGIARRKT